MDAERLAQMPGEPAQGLEVLAGQRLPADAAHGGNDDDPVFVVVELGRQRVAAAAGKEEVLIERVAGDERVIEDPKIVEPLPGTQREHRTGRGIPGRGEARGERRG